MARRNSHIHVVYGYSVLPPVGEPVAMGFGKSDNQALSDVRKKADGLFYFFVRSSGELVPAQTFAAELASRLHLA